MRDRLIELIQASVGGCARNWAEVIADHLLANGVIVPILQTGVTSSLWYLKIGFLGICFSSADTAISNASHKIVYPLVGLFSFIAFIASLISITLTP